jgi:hypothetical protein
MQTSAFIAFLIASSMPAAVAAQIRGTVEATSAAEALLNQAGGRDVWTNARTFYVEERVYLQSGDTAKLRIWRDLETGNRRLERSSAASSYVEWLSADGGFDVRDGKVNEYSPEDLAIELQGLRQEPYAVYRRLANGDPTLRVDLRNKNTLFVYDGEERLLCWFLLDGKGGNLSWGNFWNGNINQHYYGPIVDMGDANLPRWGVSTTGNFRFEYVLAKLIDETVKVPTR